MSTEDEKELREIWKFTKDFWQLIKQYYFPDPNPDSTYWHDLINDAGALGEKYDDYRLPKDLILAFLDNVEKRTHNNENQKS